MPLAERDTDGARLGRVLGDLQDELLVLPVHEEQGRALRVEQVADPAREHPE